MRCCLHTNMTAIHLKHVTHGVLSSWKVNNTQLNYIHNYEDIEYATSKYFDQALEDSEDPTQYVLMINRNFFMFDFLVFYKYDNCVWVNIARESIFFFSNIFLCFFGQRGWHQQASYGKKN